MKHLFFLTLTVVSTVSLDAQELNAPRLARRYISPTNLGGITAGSTVELHSGGPERIERITRGAQILGFSLAGPKGYSMEKVSRVVVARTRSVHLLRTRSYSVHLADNVRVVKVHQINCTDDSRCNIPSWTRVDQISAGDLIVVKQVNHMHGTGTVNGDVHLLPKSLGYERVLTNSKKDIGMQTYDITVTGHGNLFVNGILVKN